MSDAIIFGSDAWFRQMARGGMATRARRRTFANMRKLEGLHNRRIDEAVFAIERILEKQELEPLYFDERDLAARIAMCEIN